MDGGCGVAKGTRIDLRHLWCGLNEPLVFFKTSCNFSRPFDAADDEYTDISNGQTVGPDDTARETIRSQDGQLLVQRVAFAKQRREYFMQSL